MQNYVLMITIGIIAIIGGILALVNPFAASLAVEVLAAIFFLIVGVAGLFEAWRSETWGGKIFSFIIAIITVLLGIFLFRNPIAGLISLTMAVGVLIFVIALVRGYVGLKVRDSTLRWTILISAAISLILAVMILTNLPGSATFTLGLFLGIELVMDGITLVALGMSRKQGGVSNS